MRNTFHAQVSTCKCAVAGGVCVWMHARNSASKNGVVFLVYHGPEGMANTHVFWPVEKSGEGNGCSHHQQVQTGTCYCPPV